jgi:hypothetical protein
VKVYFFLLCLLYVARILLVSLPSIYMGLRSPDLFTLNHVLDVVAFSLCLAAALELGFGRRLVKRFTDGHWKLTGQATIALGILQTFLYGWGERIGMPDLIPQPGILTILRLMLPYVLFAVPAILLGSKALENKKDREEIF